MDGQGIPDVLAGDKGKYSVRRPRIGLIPSLLEQVQEAHGYLTHLPLFFLRGVYMSTIGIDKFKATRAPVTQDEMDTKLKDVSKLYEKQFLREMVKAMRTTIEHGQLTEPTMAEKIFTEKLDNEYVESWGETGGVGLADVIYGQLKEKFFPSSPGLPRPQGPVPIQPGATFKVDETKTMGIPVVSPSASGETPKKDMSYLIEVPGQQDGRPAVVKTPWSGRVVQAFRAGDDLQTVKIAHDHGLVSTLHFRGMTQTLGQGQEVSAGQDIGRLSPDSNKISWQVVQSQG